MTRAPRLLTAAVVAVLLLVPAGCVSLPESGPVVAAGTTQEATPDPGTYIIPRPPQAGASTTEIVQGFLDAMMATPISTTVARQFLAPGIRTSWDPEQQTITYGEPSPPRGGSLVTVDLQDANRLDSRGEWRGPLGPERSRLSFSLTQDAGEWRIADLPDALIVPESWFERRFSQVSLYFFDPTGRILVPEPVFVPRGEQLATSLVQGLLRGPGGGVRSSTRSFLPSGLTTGLSVPVSSAGVADIALVGGPHEPSAQTVGMLAAQLAWTLHQELSIREIQLSIDGRQIELPGGRAQFSIDGGAEFDPSGFEASAELFGLQGDLVVAGAPGELKPVPGLLGQQDYQLRSVAADLPGRTLAGVTRGGSSVLVGPLATQDRVQELVSGADDLLPPAWDFQGRLWLVDRTPDGAQVSVVQAKAQHVLRVRGITGTDVRRVLISRDGSRLVAVVHRASGDTVLVSRITYDDRGRPLSATRARAIPTPDVGSLRIRDIGWRSPTTVLVLSRVSGAALVSTVSVDGAPTGFDDLTTTARDRARELVSSPSKPDTAYAVSPGLLEDLSGPSGTDTELDRTVSSLGYSG